MQLHELRTKKGIKKAKRIGRGGKKGDSSGKGMRGQKARAGKKLPPDIRELVKRYHKLRGYRFKPVTKLFNVAVVNLDVLEKNFEEGEKVNSEVLFKKGLVRRIKGQLPKIKILSSGEIKKTLVFEDCLLSKGAKEKIEKVKGKI
ncbi:MAG: uL15 family ribosomal protein [Candidatus Nealsonbacteria bacterium]